MFSSTLTHSSIIVLSILAGTMFFLLSLGAYLVRRYSLNNILLTHEQKNQEGYIAPRYSSSMLHQQGITQTPLRPAGKVRIQNNSYQATTDGIYIDQGAKVTVTAIMGHTLVVEAL